MVVDYLQANLTNNGVHYCNFLINDDDDDPNNVWEIFLQDFLNDAWADNVAIQGLSNMLNVTFSIVSN